MLKHMKSYAHLKPGQNESKPDEKDTIVKVIVNLINQLNN